jgi:oxygen-independent coproporphyrinogen-3 oxidase
LAVAAFKNALGGLEGLKEDGLVKHEGNTLVVRPAGKRFLRNICAVFDARMASKKPEQQIFSLST